MLSTFEPLKTSLCSYYILCFCNRIVYSDHTELTCQSYLVLMIVQYSSFRYGGAEEGDRTMVITRSTNLEYVI